jgi:uncharacterized phage-like protein YoqJ
VNVLKSCAFFGHHDCPQNISKNLYDSIEKLILCENITVFYVGTHGNFDRLAYNTLCKLENIYPIQINVVLAYLNSKQNNHYDFNKTIFPSVLENTPLKYAIVKRNQYMVDNSNYVICYVNNSFSNAYTFVKRAKRKGADIINIGSYKFD